jgi:galactokinase
MDTVRLQNTRPLPACVSLFATRPTANCFVDYNDGFVLPFALPFRTYVVGAKSASKDSHIFSTTKSEGFEAPVSFVINDKLGKGAPEWANYVKGTVYQYVRDLPEGAAFDAVISSNVPLGSGLSSSAALE